MAADPSTRAVTQQLLEAAEKLREQALLANRDGNLEMYDYLMKKSAQYKDQAISLMKLYKK